MDSSSKAATYPNIEPPVLYPINIHSNPKARRYFTLVTPETVLYRWKKAIKDYWTYDKPKTRKRGRPPITKAREYEDIIVSLFENGCEKPKYAVTDTKTNPRL